MDPNVDEVLNQDILAFACEDLEGKFHFIHCTDPVKLKDIDFQDEVIRVGDFFILCSGFKSITVCNKETLEGLSKYH